MGSHTKIDLNRFPKQGSATRQRVVVCFNQDTSKTVGGVIVRNDTEEPFHTIIFLDDGRFVMAAECQYQIPAWVPPTPVSV